MLADDVILVEVTSYGVIRAKQKLGFSVGSCVGQYPRLGRAVAGCKSGRGHIVATQRRMFLWREYEARLQKVLLYVLDSV